MFSIFYENLLYYLQILARKSIQSEKGTDDYQDELKEVLTLFRNAKRPIYDITKTPEIFIQQTSSPKEVEGWLKAKNFNDKTVKSLNGLSGNQLFSLKKNTMEEYCGPKEGQRLYSQVLLQTKFSGVRIFFFIYYNFLNYIIFQL